MNFECIFNTHLSIHWCSLWHLYNPSGRYYFMVENYQAKPLSKFIYLVLERLSLLRFWFLEKSIVYKDRFTELHTFGWFFILGNHVNSYRPTGCGLPGFCMYALKLDVQRVSLLVHQPCLSPLDPKCTWVGRTM